MFTLSMQVDGEQKTYDFSNAEAMFNRFDGVSLNNEFPDYINGISAIFGQIDYRGMPMFMSYGLTFTYLFSNSAEDIDGLKLSLLYTF